MNKAAKILVRIIFILLNTIILIAFLLPYMLSVPEKDPGFTAVFWAHPLSWILLLLFLISFPVNMVAIRSLRRSNLPFRYEAGSRFIRTLFKGYIAGLWITWIMNDAEFGRTIIGGIAFGAALFGFILLMHWMVYGKRKRSESQAMLIKSLNQLKDEYPAVSLDEKKSLQSLLSHSRVYDTKYNHFEAAYAGSPARSFTVENRTRVVQPAGKAAMYSRGDPNYYREFITTDWNYYFCVSGRLSETAGTTGIVKEAELLSQVDKARAKAIRGALKRFKVTSIELTDSGLVIAIAPAIDIASLGMKIPSAQDLHDLFEAFQAE